MTITRRKKYWLGLIGLWLLLSFAATVYIQLHQSRVLENALKFNENEVSWGVFQLEREAQNFQSALKSALEGPDGESPAQLRLRYDILWSRYDVVAANPWAKRLLDSEEYGLALTELGRFFMQTERYFPPSSPAVLGRQDLRQISRTLDPALLRLQALSNHAIHKAIALAEFRTSEVRDQILISTALIVFQFLLTLVFFVQVIRLVLKLQNSHAKLDRLASFDTLTGLPNRRQFYDRLDQEMRWAEHSGKRIALMFIDLDNFKDVNDTQGHDVGDALLKEAAVRLSNSVRQSDTVARLGGDEFTVILPGFDDVEAIDRVSQTILGKLAEPFRIGESENIVSASIGITFYPDDATNKTLLLQKADQAMYVAKQQGRNRYYYFTPDMQRQAQTRMQRIHDLHSALKNNEFCLRYQPIVELASGRVHKAEALIRWSHPVEGAVSPTEFIPLAEETGLIVELSDWIFEEAAQQTAVWRQRLDPRFQTSINCSPMQFCANGTKLETWHATLKSLGLPGDAMALEITESILMEQVVSERLWAIRRIGLEGSLDGFGTGYSTLSYLQHFDFSYLKIDRAFVQALKPGTSNFVLCEAVILMAHKLGIRVIAKGIETEAQRQYLAAMGCDFGQGQLFSEPVSADEFERRLFGSGAGMHLKRHGSV